MFREELTLHVQQKICTFCGHSDAYRHRSFKCYGWSINVSLKIITIPKSRKLSGFFYTKKEQHYKEYHPKHLGSLGVWILRNIFNLKNPLTSMF